jgi:hypothetical protein
MGRFLRRNLEPNLGALRARYAFGEVFYLLPGGVGFIGLPPDRIIPDIPKESRADADARLLDSFPAAVLSPEQNRCWRPVNRLVLSDEDESPTTVSKSELRIVCHSSLQCSPCSDLS